MSSRRNVFLFRFSAKDLRQGLEDSPRWVHIEQSRLYCKYAGETLRKVQVRDTRINSSDKGLIEIDRLPLRRTCFHQPPHNLSADKLICDRHESAPTHAAFREM